MANRVITFSWMEAKRNLCCVLCFSLVFCWLLFGYLTKL